MISDDDTVALCYFIMSVGQSISQEPGS